MGRFAACAHGCRPVQMGVGVLGVFWYVCYAHREARWSPLFKNETLDRICFIDVKCVCGARVPQSADVW